MIRVVIESPFGTRLDGTRASPEEVARNIRYAERAMLDSLRRGEAPFASHLLYTRVLNDAVPADRELGLRAGRAWADQANIRIVYLDHGVTAGMRMGVELGKAPPVARYIGPEK